MICPAAVVVGGGECVVGVVVGRWLCKAIFVHFNDKFITVICE